MNDNDLSHLSYKELQALAHTYRVPGNIKKHLLVRTLEAIQGGNELEVDRMLTEVQQTRKKRVKKQKLNIMNVSSTPIHSPNYTISDDCYYTRHQPPYQWVGAEEEIAVREDEAMRVPNYKEFQEFLLRRFQRDQFQSFGTSSDKDHAPTASIVDLRMGAGTSVLRPVIVDPNNSKVSALIDPCSYVRPSSEVELQLLEDLGNNDQGRPKLLKKLLQAPVGANLGEIASPDPSSQRIWSCDQFAANNCPNPLDNSDTLTADSEIEYEGIWEDANNNGGGNNVLDYYCPMNDERNHAYGNVVDTSSRNTEAIGQMRSNYGNEGIQQYAPGYHDTHTNCEKWIAANNFVNREAHCPEPANNSVYYENNSGNATITGAINLDRKHAYNGTSENLHYEDNNQTILHGQRFNWANDNHSYYQNNNNVVNQTINQNAIYYSQQIAKIPDFNREYFAQDANGVNTLQEEPCHSIVPSVPPAQITVNPYKYPPASFQHLHENNNGLQYNSGFYSQYSHENTQQLADFTGSVNPNRQQQTTNETLETNARKNLAESSAPRPMTNVLDPFWPRWPLNPSSTSSFHLETILNLQNRSSCVLDNSKKNETSCVYCCTEPIVTQRIEGAHTWYDRNKPLIAESRQHIFTPNVLIYNDASTGMIMSNIGDSSNPRANESQQASRNSGELNSSPEQDYEIRVSDDSSDSSINDVWIHDYGNYPVSSDNALQSVDLTNDENEDDLFSAVRDSSQTSIDDHTIETFTDMSY